MLLAKIIDTYKENSKIEKARLFKDCPILSFMLKLGERNFMNISKNINKIISILFAICLISIILLMPANSIVLLLSVPIILAATYYNYGLLDFTFILIGTILVGFLFLDSKSIIFETIPVILNSVLLILLTRSNLTDKRKIAINFIITSLIFVGIYKYQMLEEGLNITKMADELSSIVKTNNTYDLPENTFELAMSLYPGILSTISLIYSILSIKLLKNFMAYKKLGSDMGPLNKERISKREFLIIIGISIIIYYLIASTTAIKEEYILVNIMWIINSILFFNGMATYDYIISRRSSNLTRGMRWFFVIIFLYFFTIIFILLGIADIFADFRHIRRENGREF